MMDHLFFHDRNLHEALQARTDKLRATISDMSAERLNGATDDELVEHFASEYRIEPLTILTNQAVAEHHETKVDVSHDTFHRCIPAASGPVLVKGDQITIRIPFTGEPELFKLKPTSFSLSSPPKGRLIHNGDLGGTIAMTLTLPSDTNDAGHFNTWIEQQLDILQRYATWIRNDLQRFNQQLQQTARKAVENRRQALEKQGSLLRKLAIPLKPRSDAPSPTPIPMPKKIVKPLPPPQKVEQEYEISEADYEYILKIIRQESRSFESTPGTFAKFQEEELRDVVLAHLNGHFDGNASGERFRKKGRTDICIEYDNRAAFVAECKLWHGRKALIAAVDQLLSYLTWRDTRTALIAWNITTKEFSKLQSEMPGVLQSHPQFNRMLNAGNSGEWRAAFRAEGDDGREVLVHVFLVNLNVSPPNAKA